MKKQWMILVLLVSFLQAENGMTGYKSRYNVDETTRRLVSILRENGVTLFKVIDHAENAKSIGKRLRPMKLVIFGNPKMGTPFMQCSPTMGLDLPQKMLIYENNASETMVTYNLPNYLFWRHNVDANCSSRLQKKMNAVLQKFAKYAAGIKK